MEIPGVTTSVYVGFGPGFRAGVATVCLSVSSAGAVVVVVVVGSVVVGIVAFSS